MTVPNIALDVAKPPKPLSTRLAFLGFSVTGVVSGALGMDRQHFNFGFLLALCLGVPALALFNWAFARREGIPCSPSTPL